VSKAVILAARAGLKKGSPAIATIYAILISLGAQKKSHIQTKKQLKKLF